MEDVFIHPLILSHLICDDFKKIIAPEERKQIQVSDVIQKTDLISQEPNQKEMKKKTRCKMQRFQNHRRKIPNVCLHWLIKVVCA